MHDASLTLASHSGLRRHWRVYALLALALVALLPLSLLIGAVSPWTLFDASVRPELVWIVIGELRLPRSILAVAIGAALGLCGAVLQGLLRNPLAEPGLVGASACGALGAVLCFYVGWVGSTVWALPLGGMVGAMLGIMLVLSLAGRDVQTLILAGVAVNSLAGALSALALNLSPNPYAATEVMFWLMGSLSDRSTEHIVLALPGLILGCAMLMRSGPLLDALSLGEDTARSMGFALERERLWIVLGCGLCLGSAVAVAGTIGFVGLMVPHLLRPWVGGRPSRVLPASALGGAILLLLADQFTRIGIGGRELQLGVVTAIIGAPFFLHLLLKAKRP